MSPRALDPMQRARTFTRLPSPRRLLLSAERRLGVLEYQMGQALDLAAQPDADTLLETVLMLPDPTGNDIGRQIILHRQVGLPDKVYIGTTAADGAPQWTELSILASDGGYTFIRNIASSGAKHAAATNENAVIVTSSVDHKIRKYNSAGTLIGEDGTFSSTVTTNGAMNTPIGIAFKDIGSFDVVHVLRSLAVIGVSQFYVLDPGTGQEPDFRVTRLDTTSGAGNGQLTNPEGITNSRSAATDGPVWIADTGNHRIQKFATGAPFTYSSQFGSNGSGDGQFSSPRGVLVNNAESEIYVADSGNDRIQVFNGSGTFQRKWGSAGTSQGQFNGPRQMAFDALGNVHVVDRGNHRVQVFESDGTYVAYYGTNGTGDGQLQNPEGIGIAPNGVIYVCDTGNSRISVWL